MGWRARVPEPDMAALLTDHPIAEALQRVLGIPVFFGMRNWHPFVQETMDQVRAAGIGRLACVCLAPQFSEMSVGLYMKHANAAAAGVERIGNTLRRLAHTPPAASGEALVASEVDAFVEEFDGGLADDLNTARALGALHTLLTRVNQALDGGGITTDVRDRLAAAIAHVDGVLGMVPYRYPRRPAR